MNEHESTPRPVVQHEGDLLSCSEFAVLVGRSERSIQRYLKTQKLIGLETLMGTRIHRSEVHKFIPDRLHRQSPTENDRPRQPATDVDPLSGSVASNGDTLRQLTTENGIPRQSPTETDTNTPTITDSSRQDSTENDSHRQGHFYPHSAGIPVEVHLEALKGIQEALRQVEQQRQALSEERRRVELVERQKLALENELSSYRRALSETAESLHEVRARATAAEARLQEPPSPADVVEHEAEVTLPFKVDTSGSGVTWGSKLKRWFFGQSRTG